MALDLGIIFDIKKVVANTISDIKKSGSNQRSTFKFNLELINALDLEQPPYQQVSSDIVSRTANR